MSWLFDRMCELAAADQLTIVIAADNGALFDDIDDSIGLAEVLRRASEIPQMTICVLAARDGPEATSIEAGDCVDLASLPESAALAQIERLLPRQQDVADTSIRVSLGTISLHDERCSHRELDALARNNDINHRHVFATDAAGHSEVFGRLSSRDLGIAIGAVDPNASIEVADFGGVISIVDAIITLRYFAFGLNDVHEDTAARRGPGHDRVA